MKQSIHLSKSSLDSTDKDAPRKKPASRDYQNESQFEDADRLGPNFSKIASNFDYSNFGLFFKHKQSNSRSSNESFPSRLHLKKKSNETSSSSRESTLKRLSSKDFSHLEDLYENTTIITTPHETKPHSKRVSNEIPLSKNFSEEGIEPWQEYLPESYSDRDYMKRKLRGVSVSGISGASKDEKQEQEIMGTISQLGLNGEGEEQKVDSSVCKDLKLSKNSFNIEVIERIKSKALHHRRTSVSNNSGHNSSGANASGYASLQSGQNEVRTNNNSVFNGSRKLNKGASGVSGQNKKEAFDCNLIDSFRNSDSLLFRPFESEISIPAINFEKQEKSAKETLPPKGPTSLLTKSIEAQEFMKEAERASKKKPNLSTIATDSTIDSDNLTTLNFNHHNNSFSTLFSATSNSFNNSGKLDFNSPLRVDSGRLTENLHMTSNVVNPQPVSAVPIQRTLFNTGQNLMGLYGGYGSGSNTDRSNSLSWNEEYTNSNFSSAIGTPQGIQKQSFFNPSLNIVPPSSNNMDRQYVCTPQSIGPQTVRNNLNSSFTITGQNLNQTMGTPANVKEQSIQFSGKESKASSSKSKKKTQEQKDNSLFEIELNKIEGNSRTTLMVKNIPNKYDLPLLLQAIEKNHQGKYDFLYLPIDPRNKCNVGYAFINFIDPSYIRDFYNEFNAKKWGKFNSEKVCDIKYARIQGKKALIHHFQYSNVMNQQDKKLKPYIPSEFELPNNQKIKDLVNKQKLESAGDSL